MFYSHKPHIKIKSIRKRCFDCAFNKFKHFDCRPNVWVSEYFEFLFDVDLSLYRDKRKITLENLQKKYGEEEGKIRFDEYRRKQAESNSLEYKIKKKGWTKEQFDEYNKSRAVTLENLQKKYGEEEGKIRFDEYRRKQAESNKLPYFIQKYGEEGLLRYLNLNKSKAVTLENLQKKYGEEEGLLRYKEYKDKTLGIGFISKSSQLFFKEFEKVLEKHGFNTNSIFYGDKTGEYVLFDSTSKLTYFYDFVCSKSKKIIEYNGDFWHCNPNFYNEDFLHPIILKTSKQIWEQDNRKIQFAESQGYNLFIIWESDLYSNKEEVLTKCLNFFMNR